MWGTQSSDIHRDRVEWWLPGAHRGEKNEELILNGVTFQICKMGNFWRMVASCEWVHLAVLSCVLKNGYDSKFHVKCFLPQLKGERVQAPVCLMKSTAPKHRPTMLPAAHWFYTQGKRGLKRTVTFLGCSSNWVGDDRDMAFFPLVILP